MQIDYQHPKTAPRPDAFSIASFTCGCLFFVPLITGLFAAILGVIGLRRTRDPRFKGRVLARAGLMLGSASFVLWTLYVSIFFIPNLLEAREQAHRIACASQMRTIGYLILMYSNENRGFLPPDLETLLTTQAAPPGFLDCPNAKRAYIYVADRANQRYWDLVTQVASAELMLYEPMTNHDGEGMNMLFGDGHVEFVAPDVAEKLIAEANSDTTPATQRSESAP